MMGGTIHSARRTCRKGLLLRFCGGSAWPSVTGRCHRKCGDRQPYAEVLRIASAKALRISRGKSAQEETSGDLFAARPYFISKAHATTIGGTMPKRIIPALISHSDRMRQFLR